MYFKTIIIKQGPPLGGTISLLVGGSIPPGPTLDLLLVSLCLDILVCRCLGYGLARGLGLAT
jgi:hypothetical protein